MTPDPAQVDIAELRALLEAATPGPWVIHQDAPRQPGDEGAWIDVVADDGAVLISHIHLGNDEETEREVSDVFAAVAARNALPALLDEVEDLRAKVAAGLALAGEWEGWAAKRSTFRDASERVRAARELKP